MNYVYDRFKAIEHLKYSQHDVKRTLLKGNIHFKIMLRCRTVNMIIDIIIIIKERKSEQ